MAELLTLPNELLYLIAESLNRPKDIASLILASRRFANLLTPLLHKIALEDKDGLSALHWAAKFGYEPLAQLVLDNGHHVDCRDKNGGTPLHFAAYHGNEPALLLLLKYGAEIHSQDGDDDTPLHSAALGRNINTIQALLNWGANPNSLGMQGNTPLHRSVQGRARRVVRMEVVRLLLDSGADSTLFNEVSRQPYFYAPRGPILDLLEREAGHVDVWECCETRGEAPWDAYWD